MTIHGQSDRRAGFASSRYTKSIRSHTQTLGADARPTAPINSCRDFYRTQRIKPRRARAAGNAAAMCACAQIATEFEHILQSLRQTVREEETIERAAFHRRQLHERPIAWREAEDAALRANAADTCDDRVSEDIFDVEDELAEVDIIFHRIAHGAN